jgi:hypothetical protein
MNKDPRFDDCCLCVGSGINGGEICPLCDGDGRERKRCDECRGRGRVVGMASSFFGLSQKRGVVKCVACGGSGRSKELVQR